MSKIQVKAIEKRVRQYRGVMIWTADMATRGVPEHWRDDYDLFEKALLPKGSIEINDAEDRIVRCDCENFTMSLEHYVWQDAGVPADKIFMFCVDTRNGDRINHATGGVEIDGVLYIWDNAQPYPFYQYQHRPRDYNFIQMATWDKPQEWYEANEG
jgi:hypothetical protein